MAAGIPGRDTKRQETMGKETECRQMRDGEQETECSQDERYNRETGYVSPERG